MTVADELVFLLDCDDTLLDNDRVLADLEQRYPAVHDVMVDDKPRILAAMKKLLEDGLRAVFPHQGHCALDPHNLSTIRPQTWQSSVSAICTVSIYPCWSSLPGARDRGREAT